MRGRGFYGLLGITALLYVVTIAQIFFRTPDERVMGVVYKIVYFHAPGAYCMYLGATACLVGSVGYLVRPKDVWDALARAGGELAVVFGAITLATGALWGAKSWGHLWAWDPQLTTTLLSVLIYVSYTLIRGFAGEGAGERRFAAALGVLGAFNLPIIHYSVKKWGGQHPTVMREGGGGLHGADMVLSMILGFTAFTLFTVLLLWARVRLEMQRARLRRLEEDAIDHELDDRTEVS